MSDVAARASASANAAGLDVSRLPSYAFGHRSTMWWGTLGVMAIEGTVFALAIGTYLYLRTRVQEWPPGVPSPDLRYGIANTLVLMASVVPNMWTKKAAEAHAAAGPDGRRRRRSAQFFSAHMVQHEALMLLAAPLLVVSRPLAIWTWALPRRWRHHVRIATAPAAVAALWRWLTAPLAAWALHALALWIWHAPRLFEAALAHRGVHALQHSSFFASALLFWWALLGRRRAPFGAGPAVGYLFTTMIHTGALGALLTIATQPWYAAYGATTAAWGLSPLEDQQLGGLIMWVPAGAVYAGVGLALVAKWLSEDRSNARPGLGEIIV